MTAPRVREPLDDGRTFLGGLWAVEPARDDRDPVAYQQVVSVAHAVGKLLLVDEREQPNAPEANYWLLRLVAPYCLQRLQNGEWLPLNRWYKPLGLCNEGGAVDYERFAAIPEDRLDLSAAWSRCDEAAWLYDDGNPPWAGHLEMFAYLKRLTEVLA
mgnify:CR=1 FL=1